MCFQVTGTFLVLQKVLRRAGPSAGHLDCSVSQARGLTPQVTSTRKVPVTWDIPEDNL
jgi:hypothetical protein